MNSNTKFGIAALAASLFAILLSVTANAEEILFEDDFESGNLDKWTVAVDKAEVVTNPVHTGSRSLYIPYDISAGEPVHRDNNRFVQKDMTEYGLDNFFVRGCFFLPSTDTGALQKKLLYIMSGPWSAPRWDLVLSAWGGVEGSAIPLKLKLGSNNYPYSDVRAIWMSPDRIQFDRWHCLDLRVQLNTPGQNDGFVELWLDGQLEVQRLGAALRDDNKPLGNVRVGAQIDRTLDALAKHEDRYWDNVAIGTGVSAGEGGTPPPGGTPPIAPPESPDPVTVQ